MIENDEDGNPIRAYHLTPEQLRLAYQQPAMNEFLEACARIRLAMLRQEQKAERKVVREEYDAG